MFGSAFCWNFIERFKGRNINLVAIYASNKGSNFYEEFDETANAVLDNVYPVVCKYSLKACSISRFCADNSLINFHFVYKNFKYKKSIIM
jgi:hypothetical protein